MAFLFFIFFIVAVVTCGSVTVGPFSLRVYATVLMLIYLVFFYKKYAPKTLRINRKYLWIFLVYIFYLFFALVVNGGLIAFDFFHKCLAYYLVCIVVFFAIDCFVNDYKRIDLIVFVFSLLIIFDSIITLLQFQDNAIGWSMGLVFRDVEEWAELVERRGSDIGASYLPGIMGHPVNNAFFLAVTTPSVLCKINKETKLYSKLYYAFVLILSIVACYYIQQRAAFFLLIAIIFYHLFVGSHLINTRNIVVLLVLGGTLVATVLSQFNLNEFEWGRLTSASNDDRKDLVNSAVDVIRENFLFGNPVQYSKQSELSAHNVFLDTFITSGIVGTLLMIVLYFKTLLDSFFLSFIKKRHISQYTRAFSYSVVICMLIGLVHNTSYFTGESMVFITLAFMLKGQKLDLS